MQIEVEGRIWTGPDDLPEWVIADLPRYLRPDPRAKIPLKLGDTLLISGVGPNGYTPFTWTRIAEPQLASPLPQ